jgi:ParB/RepB/Spo0J family partition protein
MIEVETRYISKKYESFRLKDKNREKYLLGSIQESGILKPLQCVKQEDETYILLDGYKRLRCSLKLKLNYVPVVCVGIDEAESILYIIRLSNEKTLNVLEQARFVDELNNRFGLSVSEIARRLECSPAWVCVRLGILKEMSDFVRQEIFAGRFPVRSYMYNLRPFTRVNKTSEKMIDAFVKVVSGKGLSVRNIERLAYGYFRGGERVRAQIEKGDISWALKQMNYQNSHYISPELSDAESNFIRDLELVQKYMSRIRHYLVNNTDLTSEQFRKTAFLLLEGVLGDIKDFEKEVRDFHDKR